MAVTTNQPLIQLTDKIYTNTELFDPLEIGQSPLTIQKIPISESPNTEMYALYYTYYNIENLPVVTLAVPWMPMGTSKEQVIFNFILADFYLHDNPNYEDISLEIWEGFGIDNENISEVEDL